MSLFDPAPLTEDPPAPEPQLSYGRRITLRNRALLERGVHPVTRLPLRGEGTCGDCAHHVVIRHSKTYHGCELHRGCGPATDIRVSWPACDRFEVKR